MNTEAEVNFRVLDKVGVELYDINLQNKITEADRKIIKKLILKHRVLVFKNQILNDKQLEDFSSIFGSFFSTNKYNPTLGSHDSNSPIVIIGNKADEYQYSYLGNQEVLPHSDHQWLEYPSAISLLYAIDIEKGASTTTWIDMTKVYEELPKDIQNVVERLNIITYNPFFRPFGSVSSKYIKGESDIPSDSIFSHPLVTRNYATNIKSLYLHIAYEMKFLGLPDADGEILMHYLHKKILNTSYKYKHFWNKNDIVVWDNRSTIHYRPAFNSNVRRVLKRISIAGEKPS